MPARLGRVRHVLELRSDRLGQRLRTVVIGEMLFQVSISQQLYPDSPSSIRRSLPFARWM